MRLACLLDVKRVKLVLLVAGGLAVGFLVYRVGSGPIVETLGRLTAWQFLLVCLPHTLVTAVDTLGWRFAFSRDRAPFHRLFGARLAGEALNFVTALGSVGGEAVKAWLVRRDVTYEESVPALIIAKTSATLAQGLFMVVGIGLAWGARSVTSEVLTGMIWLLVVEVLAVGGFVAVQLLGFVARAGRVLAWAGVGQGDAYARELDASLRGYYRREWRRFTLSVSFHLAGWLLGALDALVMLWVLGVTTSATDATIIEALGSGVRFATFMVPANLGASEGANAAAFAALGFGAGAGLAFSFVRRARQAVWVVIGLVFLGVMRWSQTRAEGLARADRPA